MLYNNMQALFIISFILFPLVFCFDISQYKPSCTNCKWFIQNGSRLDYGLCRLFKERVVIVDKEKLISNFAKHCRDNELLCGAEGNFYEDNEICVSAFNVEEKLTTFENKHNELIEKIDEFSNLYNGEVNEKPELDKLNQLDTEIENFTKEGLELLFKVQKFNKKKISIALDKIYPKQKHDKFTRY